MIKLDQSWKVREQGQDDQAGIELTWPTETALSVKLQVRNLSKSYSTAQQELQVLQNIDLEIYQGDLICIIGESGCGKSTLLQMIAGFEFPTSGEILADNQPIKGPDYKRGVVFQESSLLPWLTVAENITLGLDIHHQKADKAVRLKQYLEIMSLTGFENYYPAQLSGGMAQRVAIARALINKPEMILLDEPFGALDAFTRIKLQDELIHVWQQTKCTMIFVTHDIDEAVYLGTRIVVLASRPGRIARIYNLSLDHPRDRTSVEFMRLRGMIAKEFFGLMQ